ncbi:MAG: ATP-binding protein [Pyrinomonadaceae bacterium]
MPDNKAPAASLTNELIGRESETAALVERARGGERSYAVLAAPGAGLSAILRRTYHKLFSEQTDLVPVYFELRYEDADARQASIRFLREFLLQTAAFRRHAERSSDPDNYVLEIDGLSLPDDIKLIDRLVETYVAGHEVSTDRAFVRNCLNIALRAAANGSRYCVIIDGTHVTDGLSGGGLLFDEIIELASTSPTPLILGGLRRHLFGKTHFETTEVGALSFPDTGRLVEAFASRTNTTINEQTRDLISVQLGGLPRRIAAFLAGEFGRNLSNFEDVERGYTNSVFGGHLGRYLGSILDQVLPNGAAQDRTVRSLAWLLDRGGGPISTADWHNRCGVDGPELTAAVRKLHQYEIVNVTAGGVTIDETDHLVSDYIRSRSRIQVGSEQRARTVGEAMAENIRRAPIMMADFYRRSSAIGLREIMRSFDGRAVPLSMLDYGRFKASLKGSSDKNILTAALAESETAALPHVVYSAHTAGYYPLLSEICETERSAVAIGFTDRSAATQTAWIAAEIDSKLEAPRDLAEFWCDRLEMAAESSGLKDYRLWLIAPEGFTDEALTALQDRNAYGSCRKQVDLLQLILRDHTTNERDAADSDEIVVPMGEEGEMMSAKAIDEIARRHGFSQKATNQIKTAVIEACINAAEHSLSPDQKIRQKYRMAGGKLVITISNRGLRLTDKGPHQPTPDGGRRGWGLKLMRSLMDEVRIEQTDDGTRITMVKLLES